MERASNLLDEALGLNGGGSGGTVVVIEDCVETSGAFVLHHLLKRALSGGVVIFVAFAHPFSHYDRILRKMGCNLVVQRDNKRFIFLDMLTLECPDGDGEKNGEGGLFELYGKIQNAVEVSALAGSKGNISIMIDDVSLMEVAANGSSNHVLNFLHYCLTLTTQFVCSLFVLNHEDIYSSMGRPMLILQMEYLAEVIVKAEPLATGLAADVHGQLTVVNKRICEGLWSSRNKMGNFHFRVRENAVECFYPGSRT
ncbi:elongator complex protein 6 [Diospyros lotus]|uniref:elongator complex protein 6 n=1 Tax=Diospyros lotus TaxID=55363 RepID=UPI002254D150|nr:elongator complex protein 6 [Diospyros lotus]